jgi:predicted  nucleic acid-binding Zn-ribbon protein
MWAVGILSGASGGGFLLLYGLVNNLNAKMQNEIKIMNERINNTPTHQDLNKDFTRKETLDVMFDNINKNLASIETKLDKLFDKNE